MLSSILQFCNSIIYLPIEQTSLFWQFLHSKPLTDKCCTKHAFCNFCVKICQDASFQAQICWTWVYDLSKLIKIYCLGQMSECCLFFLCWILRPILDGSLWYYILYILQWVLGLGQNDRKKTLQGNFTALFIKYRRRDNIYLETQSVFIYVFYLCMYVYLLQ